MKAAKTFLAALLASLALIWTGAAQSAKEIQKLELGKPIERELAGGQTHTYEIMLAAGQYLHVVVDQRGIDVVARLIGPDGKKVTEVDSPNGTQGPEPLSAIAETGGTYRLEVTALEKEVPAGRYDVRLEELRAPTEADRHHIAAAAVLAQAGQLRARGTAGDLKKAIERYQEALPLLRAVTDRSGEANTLNSIGEIHSGLGENQKAIECLGLALSIYREVGDRRGEATMLDDIGSVYTNMGENQKAIEHLRQALPIWRVVGDRKGEANTLNNIGAVFANLDKNKEALDYYQRALPIYRAVGYQEGEATTLNNIGAVYWNLGENHKALEYDQKALSILRTVGDRAGEATTLNNIGTVYSDLGENQEALKYYQQALPIRRTVGDRYGEATTLATIGLVYSIQGEHQKAFEYFQQALPIQRAVGDQDGEATTLTNIGAAYRNLGENQKALEYYQQALPIYRAVGRRKGEAVTLNNIGFVYSVLGESQKALDYFQQALPIRRAIEDRRGEAATLNNIGLVCHNLRENQEALEYFQQALLIDRPVGDRRGEATVLDNIAQVYLGLGENRKALEYYQQALPIRRAVGDREGEATTLSNLARAEMKEGNLERARADIEAALALVESLRSNITDPELRASFTASAHVQNRTHAEILLQMHKSSPKAGYVMAALETMERGRARSLLEMLREAKADIRRGAEPALLERERVAGRQLDAKSDQLIRLLNGKHTEEQVTALKREISALETEYQQVQASIRYNSPHCAALTQPKPSTVNEIQQDILDSNTLLLEYSLGKEQSYLWAVTPESLQAFELAKEEVIAPAARRFYELLTVRNRRVKGETQAQRTERIAKAESEYQDAAVKLSELVLGPVASLMPGKRVAVVADGVLQYIPFEALAEPGTKGYTPLVLGHEVVSLPSASVLAELRRETKGRKPAAKEVAVLADPVFDAGDPRVSGETKEKASDIVLERAAIDVGAMTEEMRLPRLLFTRQEAEGITQLAGKEKSFKALDFEASLEKATNKDLSQYRMVHLATHGLLDSERPGLSGLVLSLVDEKGKPREGFLKLKDVYNLDLPAELVVLSACQTGLGKEIRGEGLVGLTRGFMYAGAKRVVASLWKVDDVATAELMKRFYRGMLAEKQRPAAALRAAQVAMQQQRRWRSPYYWAAFVLQGEWK